MSKNTKLSSSSSCLVYKNSEVTWMSLWIELILEKNCFLIFWVPILSRPKAVTDVKNSLYYGRVKDMELSPSPLNCSKDSWKLLLLLISIIWPSFVTWWIVIQKIYSEMHPISCANTHPISHHRFAKSWDG